MSILLDKESKVLSSLSNSPKSLAELADELGAGFSKTTVYRLVSSLAKDGKLAVPGDLPSMK